MGNKVTRLCPCCSISRRRNDAAAVASLPDPLDEGFGHSFCYIPPTDALPKSHYHQTTAFRTISGAAISANTSTPLSTDPFACFNSYALDKAASFESSNFFSAIPLQPIPRNSVDAVKSGPILRNTATAAAASSGPMERGFLSGPIERSFISGPLDQTPKSKKQRAYVRNFRKAIHRSLWTFSKHLNGNKSQGTTSSTATSPNLSSELSLENEYDPKVEAFAGGGGSNEQWAHGKAGEDRVHIVVSEDDGWVFVGIYDGFNGPDATDYLLNNLYSNIRKELKGLLWSDNHQEKASKSLDCKERMDLDRELREKLRNLGCPVKDNAAVTVIDHIGILKALSEALKRTEALYLETSNVVLLENPELALMGSCVLVMVMKGDDLYLMNVGDSRGVLAQNGDDEDSESAKIKDEREEELLYGYDNLKDNNLCCCQLTMDHSTSVKEEVRRIRNAHQDDAFALMNGRVKGSLKVTRAFGAGFLKHPKWNNALLEMFRIDYIGTSPYITCSPSLCHYRLQPKDKFLILSSDGLYQYFTNEEAVFEVEMFMLRSPEGDPAQHLVEEVLFRAAKKAGLDFYELLEIPQGDRRRYHDDVSIIIISFEGMIWRSSV